MSSLNPKTITKEFGGTPGAITLVIFLPAVVFFLYSCANEEYVIDGIDLNLMKIKEIAYQKLIVEFKNTFLNKLCWIAYLIWFIGLALLDVFVPGYYKQGVELRDGSKLNYLINGLELCLFLIFILIGRAYLTGFNLPELSFLYENFLPLMVTATEFSFILSTFVYISSFIPLKNKNKKGTNERILAVGGNSGNPIFDWFIGRELNPRIGSLDIKLFCELRPGLLLWFLLDLSCIHEQYHKLGYITNSLILVTLLQGFYIFDGVLNEEGCLTMIDITTDGFGFMLCYGDLTWVPFSYCLQARYLSLKEINLNYFAFFSIIALKFLGYYIFHSSNTQKSEFRQGKLPHLKSLQTKRGTKLLIEGWWGLAQHINYFGDVLMAISWSLPTGFNTPLTYFYVIYFTSLLLHRQIRDEEKCSKKYDKDWEEYKKLVPYKFIPYIF
ncbi:hypothetical protein B5S28_g2453 [[Candida] boidinii]|nr:hypothetical protein B5S28_g2453 [[Candida] boidinii]OWB62547.1 hypothetical protein B5S29_g3480 [[Candida] boidinii]OWB73254.1 hypothetical protein B5S31_g2988 [[Candida] boidinii]